MANNPDDVSLTVRMAEVIHAFLRDPGRAKYGYELMAETGLASGTIYKILGRLTAAAFVEKRWEDIDAVTAGRPRRAMYRLTPMGESAARAKLAELQARISLDPSPPAGWDPGGILGDA